MSDVLVSLLNSSTEFKSNFAFNNPIFRCMSITNEIINLIDIFNNVSPETLNKNTVIVLDQFSRK